MQINSFTPGFGGVTGSGSVATRPASGATGAGAIIPDRADLMSARRALFRVLQSFDEVQRLMTGGSRILSGLPSARSDPALDLDLTATAATLGSVEEVNATPTSFSPFVPTWNDNSSAFLTFGGAYDGSNGSGALSFDVVSGGVHGVDRLRIRVRDPNGNVLRNVTIRENDDIDSQYDIGNGLFFVLSPGDLERRDSTTIDVFDSIGSAVDTDKPFNGTGNDNPNFEYGLPEIVAGSFSINGVTISVAEDDSLNDVLNAINQSAAEVTAVFNTQTERVELSHNSLGSSGAIDIEAGDSNFVEATKLLDAVLAPGSDPETARTLESVDQFAGVSSGSFIVNGEEITVDASQDSLDDVIARINASDVGAQASFDAESQQVIITATDAGDSLEIDGNGTGIFDALNLPQGRLDPQGRTDGYARRRAQNIVDAMGEAMEALNAFFQDTKKSESQNRQLAALRSQVGNAFKAFFGDADSSVDTGFGLSFNLNAVGKEYSRFVSLDSTKLSRQLQTRASHATRYFFSGNEQPGLLNSVATATQSAFLSLNATLGTRGTLFDAYV